jgi:serine/threonine protein phosphatase PrpC
MLLPTDSGFYPRTQLVTPSSASGPFSAPDNQPTIEMSPSTTRNGLTDSDKTRTDPLRQANNQNVGFGVITRTDPGIKRKHKPNEDSLFAAQGTREANSSPQQVGLFVVADGMGGHANGQDASRLAIQTIINYILPKLVQNGEVTGNAFQQLLIDGVQCANQAVHQRNMEQRADMGTTMTAALIVAPIGVTYAEDDTRPPTAVGYIANVGDSRTYLYRQGRGLVKLTNDHSVVASLVEAGIIRPDDIYTHPKRNQIYRSLGEKPAVEVDSFVVALEVDDKLLLCSDGLWDMVRDPQIEEVLKHPVPPNMAGDALIQAALNGGGEDNISVIVVQIPDPNKLNARLGIQLIDKPEAVQMPQL